MERKKSNTINVIGETFFVKTLLSSKNIFTFKASFHANQNKWRLGKDCILVSKVKLARHKVQDHSTKISNALFIKLTCKHKLLGVNEVASFDIYIVPCGTWNPRLCLFHQRRSLV